MHKVTSMAVAAILFAFPAFGQTFLAANVAGPINQAAFLNLDVANTNVVSFFTADNEISATAVANAAAVEQVNDFSILTLNAQGGINQAAALTAQLSQTNVLSVLTFGNDISATSVTNAASVSQTNGPFALGALNLQAGINQISVANVAASQTNVASGVTVGNTVSATSAANAANISQNN